MCPLLRIYLVVFSPALLGGAGTIISRAGIAKANLKACLHNQITELEWNKRGADWRVGMCLSNAGVALRDAHFMLMVNEAFVRHLRHYFGTNAHVIFSSRTTVHASSDALST